MEREEIQLMRRSLARQTSVSIGTTDTAFIPANPNRVALLIGSPNVNPVWISFMVAASTTAGIQMQATNAPLQFLLSTHGDAVRGPIRAISPTAAQTLTFWEVELDDSVGREGAFLAPG